MGCGIAVTDETGCAIVGQSHLAHGHLTPPSNRLHRADESGLTNHRGGVPATANKRGEYHSAGAPKSRGCAGRVVVACGCARYQPHGNGHGNQNRHGQLRANAIAGEYGQQGLLAALSPDPDACACVGLGVWFGSLPALRRGHGGASQGSSQCIIIDIIIIAHQVGP